MTIYPLLVVIYLIVYEAVQLKHDTFSYFFEFWNWFDIIGFIAFFKIRFSIQDGSF